MKKSVSIIGGGTSVRFKLLIVPTVNWPEDFILEREELRSYQKGSVFLDLKPTLSYDDLHQKIKESTIKKTSEKLQKEIKLSAAQVGLLKKYLSKETYLNPELLALG